MEQLFREVLAKFEETATEIKELEYLRVCHANRQWPELAPLRAQLEEIREELVAFVTAPPRQLTEEEWHKPIVPSSWKSQDGY